MSPWDDIEESSLVAQYMTNPYIICPNCVILFDQRSVSNLLTTARIQVRGPQSKFSISSQGRQEGRIRWGTPDPIVINTRDAHMGVDDDQE